VTTVLNPKAKAIADAAYASSPAVHPDYVYWSPVWQMIRDAEIGEIEIKRKGQTYLPKLQGHDDKQYLSYLHRAVFFNMTAKTLSALYGTMFRRNPKVTGLSKALMRRSKKFSKDGMSLHLTAKTAAKEVLSVGRFGMLVDAAPSGRGGAYVATYTAENIIDWKMTEVGGEWRFSRVILREISYDDSFAATMHEFKVRYRVLRLMPVADGTYVYEQHIYEDRELTGTVDVDAAPDDILVPTVRGQKLDYIPFVILGPFTNHPDVQKPPILDIVTLNLSHYLSYAQLEQGRFYTANPVYTVSSGVADDSTGEYYVGPDVVWELGKDGKAAILEFNGHGLRTLENALDQKESQISAIGGRMMPGHSRGAAESDNALRLKESNEQTLLQNLSDTTDEGFTQTMKWWADWNNESVDSIDNIEFEVNRDFLIRNVGAREFRAIHQMYADGAIPVDVLYEYLRRAEVVPDWMELDEFKRLLEDSKQFPNVVDVLARMNNFPDAETMFEYINQIQKNGPQEVQPAANDPDDPSIPRQVTDLRSAQARGR
jgi:hypothetical protein